MSGAQARGHAVRRLEASELSPEATQAAMKLVRAMVMAVQFHGCDIATLEAHERGPALVVAVEIAKGVMDAMVENAMVKP